MYTALIAAADKKERKALCATLKTGFAELAEVKVARNTQECLLLLETGRVDLILLDAQMPGSNTYAITQCLKQNNKDCVVLLLADLDRFDPERQTSELPVMDCIFRPYSEREVLLTLEEAFHACEMHCRASEAAPEEAVSSEEENKRMRLVREKVESYIRDHYREPLSLQDVARAMNYSDAHFCRLFKSCFKVNFAIYLNEYRVGQAKHMLTATNTSVKDIGLSCGYRDTSYFIRVFKRSTGMTPSDYRISLDPMSSK